MKYARNLKRPDVRNDRTTQSVKWKFPVRSCYNNALGVGTRHRLRSVLAERTAWVRYRLKTPRSKFRAHRSATRTIARRSRFPGEKRIREINGAISLIKYNSSRPPRWRRCVLFGTTCICLHDCAHRAIIISFRVYTIIIFLKVYTWIRFVSFIFPCIIKRHHRNKIGSINFILTSELINLISSGKF